MQSFFQEHIARNARQLAKQKVENGVATSACQYMPGGAWGGGMHQPGGGARANGGHRYGLEHIQQLGAPAVAYLGGGAMHVVKAGQRYGHDRARDDADGYKGNRGRSEERSGGNERGR